MEKAHHKFPEMSADEKFIFSLRSQKQIIFAIFLKNNLNDDSVIKVVASCFSFDPLTASVHRLHYILAATSDA